MSFDKILEPLKQIQAKMGDIPLDGVVITAFTYFSNPPETRIMNSLIIGGIHYVLHEFVSCPKVKHEFNESLNVI